jgi:hypothetical protein
LFTDHVAENGLARDRPTDCPSTKKSTRLTVPSVSAAVALNVTLVGAVYDVPLAGAVIVTDGGAFAVMPEMIVESAVGPPGAAVK